MTGRIGTGLVGVVIGGAFYLLLIDTTSLPELYVLAGVAATCGVAYLLGRQQELMEARIAPTWLLSTVRLLVRIPQDIVLVCREAVAQLLAPRAERGSFRAARFDAVAATPPDTGRRALVETLGSAAPNTIIVGVDAERELLLVHQLHRRGGPQDLDSLRLG